MSARTRTLLQLRDGVADRGDIVIGSSARHTTTTVNARINRAIQRWLLMVAEAGDDTNLVTSRTTTATSTTRDANNWAPNQYIAQPSNMLLLRGVDIYPRGVTGVPVSMLPADELERSDASLLASWIGGGTTGMPITYRLGGTNASNAYLIQIFPYADAAYTVDLRYIKTHTDLSGDSETIDFIAGGEEWVINDTVMQSKMTDGISSTADMSAIIGWNKKIEDELRFTLACRGTTRRQDTFGRRRALMAYAPWRVV